MSVQNTAGVLKALLIGTDKVLPVVAENLVERIIPEDAGTISHGVHPADVKRAFQATAGQDRCREIDGGRQPWQSIARVSVTAQERRSRILQDDSQIVNAGYGRDAMRHSFGGRYCSLEVHVSLGVGVTVLTLIAGNSFGHRFVGDAEPSGNRRVAQTKLLKLKCLRRDLLVDRRSTCIKNLRIKRDLYDGSNSLRQCPIIFISM
jgi:hypothetical protein